MIVFLAFKHNYCQKFDMKMKDTNILVDTIPTQDDRD